jgi:thymidylate synthase (FAD)
MKVRAVAVTQPTINKIDGPMSVDEFIAYVARVSNPSNQMNTETAPKLLQYLVTHNHWSPFEMAHVTMEIETTRDIARQILRHRSFSFQEFSQRYADPTGDLGFERREARLQDQKNRQNSVEIDVYDNLDHRELNNEWILKQIELIKSVNEAYRWAISNGIAKEQARAVLPEGMTVSRMYMAGSVRSWIHYCQLRMANGTQKEHREIAVDCWGEVCKLFPSLQSVV